MAAAGHEIVSLARPGGAARTPAKELEVVRLDAGDPTARTLVAGCDAVLHFAGIPDPGRSRADPARAVRENVGTALNLLEGCREHGAGLVYPSTIRAAIDPPPDEYALSKQLGEAVCRLHQAPATVVRLTSVFGPGQIAWEGATGAIASFAAQALDGGPVVIAGDPARERDFVYVDDVIPTLAALVERGLWNETVTLAAGRSTSLQRAAELVRDAARTDAAIETTGGTLTPGENESYGAQPSARGLPFHVRPLEEAVQLYVDWLKRYAAPQGSSGG
jgi:nucleoside-diphosphate-sugar epimerase